MRHKWLQITLGVLMFLLALQVQRADSYQYDETPDDDTSAYFTPETKTSTKWQDGTASAGADVETGTCSCGAHTYSQVYANGNDSAAAWAYAYGWHRTDWVWNGPPGTAPGGTLDWGLDGQGSASISADREYDGGSTHCAASAWSETGADSRDGLSFLTGWAEGSVDDLYTATVDMDCDVYVTEGMGEHYFPTEPPQGYGAGWFDVDTEDWWVWDSGSADIPEGTAQFYFSGAAVCESYSEADAAGPPKAWSMTYASALVLASASFTSD